MQDPNVAIGKHWPAIENKPIGNRKRTNKQKATHQQTEVNTQIEYFGETEG